MSSTDLTTSFCAHDDSDDSTTPTPTTIIQQPEDTTILLDDAFTNLAIEGEGEGEIDFLIDGEGEEEETNDEINDTTTSQNTSPQKIIDRTSIKPILLNDFDFTIPPQHINHDESTPLASRKVKDPINPSKHPTNADIPRLVTELRDPDQNIVHSAIYQIRKLLSVSTGSPIAIIHTTPGASQSIIWLLQSNDISIQYEALWALTNLFSGERWITEQLIELNALKPLLLITTTEQPNLLDQVLWCLGNIAGDVRDVFYKDEHFPLIQQVVERSLTTSFTGNVCKTLAWVVSNLVRGKPSPSLEKAKFFLPYIVTNFTQVNQDPEVLIDSLWALTYLTDHTVDSTYFVELCLTQYNLSRHFIDLLQSNDNTILTPALRAAGNCVASATSSHTQILLHDGLLDSLVRIISTNTKVGIQKEAAWTMSNIAAGTIDQIEYLAESNAFITLTTLIPQVQHGVLKEIIYVGANVLSGIQYSPIEEKVVRNLLSSNWFKQLAKVRLDPTLYSLFFEMIRHVLVYGDKHKVVLPFEGKKQEVNLSAFMLKRDGIVRVLIELAIDRGDKGALSILDEFFPGEVEDGIEIEDEDENEDENEKNPFASSNTVANEYDF